MHTNARPLIFQIIALSNFKFLLQLHKPVLFLLNGFVPESRATRRGPDKALKSEWNKKLRLDSTCLAKSHSEAADDGMRNLVLVTWAGAQCCQIYVPRPSGLKKIFERGLQKKLDVVILKIISQIYIR